MMRESPIKKYVILMDDNNSSVRETEKQLSVKFTSSAELSSSVRARNIFESGDGLYLKNLGVAIVEGCDVDQLTKLNNASRSLIVHWEEERIFKTQTELELIDDIRSNIATINSDIGRLTDKLNRLELLILERKEKKVGVENMTWGLNAIGLAANKYSGKGVDICVLDTGFYLDHPDFKGRNISGKSFISDQSWDVDVHGHGTHCVGIAAGGVSHTDDIRYGIANEANIIIAKVLDDLGNGSTSGVIDALDNCLEKKHKLVSMSLGSPVKIGEKPSLIFEHIGRRALENNCLIIAAAGNESKRPNIPKPVDSPANAESIMAVAALTKSLEVANFSNAGINAGNGGRVDLSAPGVDIFSSCSLNIAKNKLYQTMSGTSVATPHVSGMAALYWEAQPDASAKDIWLRLEKYSKRLTDQLVRDVGNGLVHTQ